MFLDFLGRPECVAIALFIFVICVGIRLDIKRWRISTLNVSVAKFLSLGHLSRLGVHRLKLLELPKLIISPIIGWISHSLRAVSLLKHVVTVIATLSRISALLNKIGQFDLSLRLGVIQAGPFRKVVVYQSNAINISVCDRLYCKGLLSFVEGFLLFLLHGIFIYNWQIGRFGNVSPLFVRSFKLLCIWAFHIKLRLLHLL